MMSQNGSAMYGWRARIGMIIPSTNAVAEPQVRMMAPDGVEFHTTRLAFAGTSEANVTRFIAEAGDGAKLLADAGVDMVVLNCTAATMFRPGIDAEAVGIMTEASGKKCTTVSRGVVDALRTLEARRVVLTSPYETNAREQAFLEHHQIAVLNEVGLKLKPQQFPKVEPGDWYRQVRAQEDEAADAYFLSCTAVRTAEVIETLERDLDRPVVTSNQAMVWHCLKELGVRVGVAGYGRLFDTLAA
jgi:maleate isomerase